MPSSAARSVGLLQVGLGLLTVASAPRVATVPWWRLPRRAMVAVVIVLGLRQIAQGAVTVARPRTEVLYAGSGVDVLHALSLVPVAAAIGPYRDPARRSAGLALTTALVAAAVAAGRRP